MAEAAFQMYCSFIVETCIKCGCVFGVPNDFDANRRKDKESFYCPNGHPQFYSESEEDRLRKQLAAKERELETSKRDANWQRERRQQTERQLIASKGQLTKVKRRIGNGVCPCCHRTFINVQRHMNTKHPDYKEALTA